MHVDVRTIPDIRVAYLRATGPYGGPATAEVWQQLSAWAGPKGFFYPRRRMFGISHDNPDTTAPERCRYDACIEVDADFQPDGAIQVQTLPGGMYACAAFAGGPSDVHDAWTWFTGTWFPDSGYGYGDGAVFEQYDVDAEMDASTGRFSCLLCMPVVPLTARSSAPA